jgi:lipopolysaccharide/colanic/teichoic acid biosynthesis glycosyltransferase
MEATSRTQQLVQLRPLVPAVRWNALAVIVCKRVMDLLFAIIGLILSLPLFLIIGLCIRLTSKGPIFYTQKRAGQLLAGTDEGALRFTTFRIIKFRSMIHDAEKRSGAVLARERDPRVTPVGRFLRRTRLDELPQLINVFFGEMSLVGPRPERPELLLKLSKEIPFFEERMRGIKPGLTGLAQVSLGYTGHAGKGTRAEELQEKILAQGPRRSEAYRDFELKLGYDLAYLSSLERFSSFLCTDLLIITKTPLVMLSCRGR